jgi:hypothetical protein
VLTTIIFCPNIIFWRNCIPLHPTPFGFFLYDCQNSGNARYNSGWIWEIDCKDSIINNNYNTTTPTTLCCQMTKNFWPTSINFIPNAYEAFVINMDDHVLKSKLTIQVLERHWQGPFQAPMPVVGGHVTMQVPSFKPFPHLRSDDVSRFQKPLMYALSRRLEDSCLIPSSPVLCYMC